MDDKVIELYKICGNGGLVAKQLGLTTYKVYSILRKNGIEPKKVGGKEKASLQDIKVAYESGLSIAQVAQKFNMNASSVFTRLQRHGIKMRTMSEALILSGYTKISKDREQEVIDLYLSGQSAMQIAHYFGLKSKDPVLDALKRCNVKCRDNFGANNSSWRGGKVPLNKLIRNSQKYTDFVKHIMQSRDYTCELTGQRGGKLNVHHVKPFAQLVDEFMKCHGHISDRAQLCQAIDTYAPFWDESNVILITEVEHKTIHGRRL